MELFNYRFPFKTHPSSCHIFTNASYNVVIKINICHWFRAYTTTLFCRTNFSNFIKRYCFRSARKSPVGIIIISRWRPQKVFFNKLIFSLVLILQHSTMWTGCRSEILHIINLLQNSFDGLLSLQFKSGTIQWSNQLWYIHRRGKGDTIGYIIEIAYLGRISTMGLKKWPRLKCVAGVVNLLYNENLNMACCFTSQHYAQLWFSLCNLQYPPGRGTDALSSL